MPLLLPRFPLPASRSPLPASPRPPARASGPFLVLLWQCLTPIALLLYAPPASQLPRLPPAPTPPPLPPPGLAPFYSLRPPQSMYLHYLLHPISSPPDALPPDARCPMPGPASQFRPPP
ncbi:hypothetical protein B0H13DRAFT_2305941 [Mycena leptocephala]|nr:hypothetical protein B0H13DRAFT_2305941 [Mycena leptocephala]